LLIAADPDFAAEPSQIIEFLNILQQDFGFRYVKAPKEWMPGIQVHNSAQREMWYSNPYTGEKRLLSMVPKWSVLEQISEIPTFIDREPKFGLRVSGIWPSARVPLPMMVCDGTPFEKDLTCFVCCSQRAKPICTGDWYGEGRGGEREFGFDDSESPIQPLGVFTHPCTGKRVEVPGAGNARFWIQFEFGKWLVPKMTESFDVLERSFLNSVQACFRVSFIQAGRAVG